MHPEDACDEDPDPADEPMIPSPWSAKQTTPQKSRETTVIAMPGTIAKIVGAQQQDLAEVAEPVGERCRASTRRALGEYVVGTSTIRSLRPGAPDQHLGRELHAGRR